MDKKKLYLVLAPTFVEVETADVKISHMATSLRVPIPTTLKGLDVWNSTGGEAIRMQVREAERSGEAEVVGIFLMRTPTTSE